MNQSKVIIVTKSQLLALYVKHGLFGQAADLRHGLYGDPTRKRHYIDSLIRSR